MPYQELGDDGIPTGLPLPEYVRWAWKRNAELYRPKDSQGEFRTPLWDFVRFCRAHPDLRGRSANDALQRVKHVEIKRSSRTLTWAKMFPESDDPEAEFIATWGSIRLAAGDDILDMAAALAKERPLHPKNCISSGYVLYVSIAGRLQELRPRDYINLPVERLAKALGMDQRTISYYSKCAKNEGFISLIGKHHKPSGTAAKYAFHCERFNMETGEELIPEETLDCHKDCKGSEDSEDVEEHHEQKTTSRTFEEVERQGGARGFGFDLNRVLGNSRVERPNKTESNRLSEKREELKRQAQFLSKKKAAGS